MKYLVVFDRGNGEVTGSGCRWTRQETQEMEFPNDEELMQYAAKLTRERVYYDKARDVEIIRAWRVTGIEEVI